MEGGKGERRRRRGERGREGGDARMRCICEGKEGEREGEIWGDYIRVRRVIMKEGKLERRRRRGR